jgi:hypothetical protein
MMMTNDRKTERKVAIDGRKLHACDGVIDFRMSLIVSCVVSLFVFSRRERGGGRAER